MQWPFKSNSCIPPTAAYFLFLFLPPVRRSPPLVKKSRRKPENLKIYSKRVQVPLFLYKFYMVRFEPPFHQKCTTEKKIHGLPQRTGTEEHIMGISQNRYAAAGLPPPPPPQQPPPPPTPPTQPTAATVSHPAYSCKLISSNYAERPRF